MKYLKISIISILFVCAAIACEQELGMYKSDSSDVGQSGSMARFTINGDYLYAVDRSDLNVFKISNNSKPEFIRKENIGFDIETIFTRGDKLYIGAETGMYIFRLSNPERPQQIVYYSHIYSCDPVVANDNYAFVTLSTSSSCGRWANELHVIDISDLPDIEQVATYEMTNPKGLGLKGDKLYLCDMDELKIFDVSDVDSIKQVGSISNSSYDVIPLENTLITIGENGFKQYTYTETGLEEISEILIDQN